MIRVALYILVVGAIAAGTAWLADRPGEVVLTWQGWQVETTVMVALIALIVLVVALMLLWWLVRLIIGGPGAVSGYFRSRRRTRGYQAISKGMIAVGAGDARLARHYANESRRLMRNEPLALLLEAQAAQLNGDRAAARRVFETMIGRPETEMLGLRGLYIEAQRDGDLETARLCVVRAAERGPGIAWAASALFDMQTRDGDWAGALATLERNVGHGLIDKKQAKRARAVLLTAQALEHEARDAPETALTLALEAHKLAPELVPAAVVAARQSAAMGNPRQATKIIEKTWRLSPHPDLAEVYAHARAGDSARDRLKRAKTLLSKMPNNVEGRIGVAVAAIEARDWSQAREALEPIARSRPSQRVCLLMAEIAEGETGDAGLVREWLARAVRAPRDPAWVADGYVSERWAPVSPVTGRLDAFEWKVPMEVLGVDADRDGDRDADSRQLPAGVAGPLLAARTATPDDVEPGAAAAVDTTIAPASATAAGEIVSEGAEAVEPADRSPVASAASAADVVPDSPRRGPAETGAGPVPAEPVDATGVNETPPVAAAAAASHVTATDIAANPQVAAAPDRPSATTVAAAAAPAAVLPVQPPAPPAAEAVADPDTPAPGGVLDAGGFPARLPDDPGPLADVEDGAPEPAPKRRFGLFGSHRA
ncbi:HemY protein [Tepidamorphus gemmatus]|uniref:HemY protein n=1 Tax=Tepidamorphus gemmatus TaxID=747076 RepID=A0A4R3MFC3_9HYPH|nr:heme biosynthesis HemY N-terminal domain-containing protein [Tepidamorphus gemmatus]TCT11773.1 HemY protein [Tepidamorphus gemmatus]